MVSLTYRRKPSEEVSYDSPPPLTFERDLFFGLLDGDVLVLTPKDHYPSIELAQGPAERFLRAWEIDAELRSESGSIAFDYETGEVFQADEAHTGNATSADQFGLKRGREQALQHDWINSEVDEDPSIDHASYHR